MTFDAAEFGEDTDFERFVVERLGAHRIGLAEPAGIHDARGKGTGTIIPKAGSIVAGTSLREELRESLHPLTFGAAYKILDMLVEHVLRANGPQARRLSFKGKKAALQSRPATLPVPLDRRPELWDRLAGLYIALQQARHAVTHRRAQATAIGDLEIYDDARRIIDSIAAADVEAFAAAVHAVAELVIDQADDERRASILAWHLNAIESRHQLPALPASDPNAGRRRLIMDLDESDDGRLRLDLTKARTIVNRQPPCFWDLELHARDWTFTGRWEDAPGPPDSEVRFSVGSPPPWLSPIAE